MIRPVTAAWVALAHLIGLGALILASVMNPVTPPQPLRVQLAMLPPAALKASGAPRISSSAKKTAESSTADSTPTASAPTVAPAVPPAVPPSIPPVMTQNPTEVKTQATPQVTSQVTPSIAAPSATQVPSNAAGPTSSRSPPVITSPSVSASGSVMTSAAQPTAGPAVAKRTDSQPRVDASFRGNRPPDYPAISRRMGEQGVVVLRVMIETDGRAAEVVVARSSGSARLDQAAITAIRQWRFIPAQQGGQPVSQWYDWRWEFRLKD